MAYRTQTDKNIQHLQPPQSLETEQTVLGAALKDEMALNQVVEVLASETFFYSPKHQIVYRAMLDLYQKTEPCDITTVANELERQSKLEKVGGRVFLAELVESIVSTSNVKAHARIVLEKFMLRRLIQTSDEISASCYDHDLPVEELLDRAEATIFQISEKRLTKGFVPVRGLVDPAFEDIEQIRSSGGAMGAIKTGFDYLDELSSGFHEGELIIIAGRPSMGKTALALNIAEHVAMVENVGVALFSLEMSAEQLVIRMLCSKARVSQQKVRSGKATDEEMGRLVHAADPVKRAPIFIDDSATLSALEMRAKARRLKAQQNVGLIIVDYLQMMHGAGKYENRQQEMSNISRSLKALAKELELPVVALSQLSRQVEQRGGEKRPVLSDLRESGAIEQDADLVSFIYRPEFYMSDDEKKDARNFDRLGMAELIVAKQRNGPTGTVKLTFVKEYARFENMEIRHQELPPDADPVDGGGYSPF